ncbi:major facilitator transporter [Oceanicola sp. 22II-s10i]|uniref:MFS transporter n=1 Tax=Oceanicola sp. 22II-s10i TaxID=1317116 RepID=UPI000B522B7E|nr:MFS transporter [Oceanicola sp. 22II-s10i]OWU83891.1 major facilitator transporter [Oceanicola sp. 22II-s10i]
MLQVLGSAWALLLGLMLLMLGNGIQGTLLGIRGQIEGFSTLEMSIVMSAYFLGFLGGSRLAPEMIRRVGHVRVFAALGSFISAVLILYPAFANPWAWTLGRVVIGFCFSGVYVTAESWLNNAATNENRGKALSLYMIVQMIGIIAAQGLLVLGDPSGFILFIIPSVLVSISFAPILLSVSPTPAFDTTKPMSLRALYGVSPLSCVGVFLLGGAFSAQFGMAAVYGAAAGLSVAQISLFIAMFYVGATVAQYPLGWLSDRMDRRVLIMIVSAVGGFGAVLGAVLGGYYVMLLVAAVIVGGMSNPLYSLLISYANDFLDSENMAAASGGMIFMNGLGAISGPLIAGWLIEAFGPPGFWIFVGVLLIALAAYAAWRMTRRPSRSVEEQGAHTTVLMQASPVAVEAAQEWAAEQTEEAAQDDNQQKSA